MLYQQKGIALTLFDTHAHTKNHFISSCLLLIITVTKFMPCNQRFNCYLLRWSVSNYSLAISSVTTFSFNCFCTELL